MIKIYDDRVRELLFGTTPKRIVSLVPSDTLTLAELGCAGALVGRTDYCELPTDVVAKIPSIGGTKNPRVDDIAALEPDLVLANQEENTRSDLEDIAQRGFKIYVGFPKRVGDGIAQMAKFARVMGVATDPSVKELMRRAYANVRDAEAARAATAPLRVFCPIWMDPLMTIHGDTFISDMLDLCGAQNVFADRERRYPLAADLSDAKPLTGEKVAGRDKRYPRVTLAEVVARKPQIILLPNEPHPFTDADADVFRALDVAHAVVNTDGKDLCWYGSRSVDGLPRLRALIDAHRPG